MDKTLYVVYLGGVPLGAHPHLGMALNEAKERSIDGKAATIGAFTYSYVLDSPFETEASTEPDCVPCSHGLSCDDAWKTHDSGAV